MTETLKFHMEFVIEWNVNHLINFMIHSILLINYHHNFRTTWQDLYVWCDERLTYVILDIIDFVTLISIELSMK